MRVVFVVCGLWMGCAGASDDDRSPVDRTQQCTQLEEHVLDLRLAGIEGGETPEHGYVDLEAHRSAMRGALGSGFVASCAQHLSDDQIRCALAAEESSAAAACATGGKP